MIAGENKIAGNVLNVQSPVLQSTVHLGYGKYALIDCF